MEARPVAVEIHPEVIEVHPVAVDGNLGAVEARPQTVQDEPVAVKTYPRMVEAGKCGLTSSQMRDSFQRIRGPTLEEWSLLLVLLGMNQLGYFRI